MPIKIRLPLAIALFTLTLIACSPDTESVEDNPSPTENNTSILPNPQAASATANVQFQIDKTTDKQCVLSVSVEIDSGSWIVSPLSNDYPYGNMKITLKDSSKLKMIDEVEEEPASTLESEYHSNMEINIIRESTVFKQKIIVKTQQDFEVEGSVWFVLEPICTVHYELFVITQKSGELTIKMKMKPSVYVD